MTVQFAQVATESTPNHKMANGLGTFESRPVDQFWEEREVERGGKQCAKASDGIFQREKYNEEDDENRSR